MKMTLHIGTPKTGTTALQKFLAANPASLAKRGVHYAACPGAAQANAIANALHNGEDHSVRGFFETHVEQARAKAAHTVVVSAENFYGMAALSALNQRRMCKDAPEREQALIARLRTLIPAGVKTVRIVCYFRRPDRFAESLYNQHIKGSSLFSGDFGAFSERITPILYYHRIAGVWATVFGKENCLINSYEATSGNIVADFMSKVLNERDLSPFSSIEHRHNERISRDLLEFKRITNGHVLLAEKGLEYRIFSLMKDGGTRGAEDPGTFQDFLSPRERADLLKRLEPETSALRQAFDLPDFPAFDLCAAEKTWKPYPGLSPERRQEMDRLYNRLNSRADLRMERFLKRTAFRLRRLPGMGTVLDAVRKTGMRYVVLGLMSRVQKERTP